MNELIVKAEAEAVEQLEAEGVTFNEVDKAAFKRAARGVYDYDRFPHWTAGLYERVQALLDQYRRARGEGGANEQEITEEKERNR